jgi:hypothetical protein
MTMHMGVLKHAVCRCFRVAVVVAFAGLVGCLPQTLSPPRIDEALITSADRGCADDGDCVIVDAECCGCTSTGDNAGRTAVNVDAVDAIDERRAAVCPGLCDAAVSRDATCCAELTAACIDAQCEVYGVACPTP